MFVKIREVCYIRRETNFSYTVGQVCLEYERMTHQGNRSDLTGNHLGITAEQVGRKFNVSGRTVSRYIRLGLLDKGILDFIAVNKLSIRTGVELSYLSCNVQNVIVCLLLEGRTITLKQSIVLRELSNHMELSEQTIRRVCGISKIKEGVLCRGK